MKKDSFILRYGVALSAVGVALLLTFLLQERSEANVFAVFLAAVMLAAWYGGLVPGLLATVLAGLALDYFFIGQPNSLEFDLGHLQRLTVFAIVAILISSLTGARKRSEEALRKAHQELELRVQERTAELAKTNAKLQAEITERKRAEIEAAQAARQLALQNNELLRLQGEMGRVERLAALGQITGTIAHELGTPLNSVLGYAQLLVQDDLPDSARRRLHIIKAQVERMVEIINQYLSRTRSSFQQRHRIEVNALVRETLELLKPVFQQRGVQVKAALADSVPPLSGDEASLQRVLINLLDNAVDAMEGGGKVTVSTRASEASEKTGVGVVIEVTDTGGGIAPEMLPKIFEFFVTTKAPGKGTGLGLAICREIVKGHGGTMRIDSKVGTGTSVRVFLPAAERLGQSVPA